jgi:hypothetical protein
MPDRNTDILSDLKRQIHSARKGSLIKTYAVIDRGDAEPGREVIGSVLFCGTSKADMILFNLDFCETDPKPRTSIIQLKAPLPVGALVVGNDLAPQT